MRFKSKPANMHDVAREAGVSSATVSRVFNGKLGSVLPDTVEKVRAAATRLGYTPSEIGRSLRLSTTSIVVMLVPDATNDFCADVAISVERSLKPFGLSMVLMNTSEDPEQQDQLLSDAEGLRARGMVVLGAIDTPKLREVAARNKRLVFVNRRPPKEIHAPYVGIDNRAAGATVGRYFLEKDYKECLVIHGPLDYSASRERLEGFLEGLGDDARVQRIESALTMEAGYEHGLKLLNQRGVRAVFCGNDMIAYGIYRAAMEGGVRVPEDLAICGFDDNRVNAWLAPWLTSVRIPALDFGVAVAAFFDPDAKSDVQEDDVVLPFELMKRKSA